MERENRITLRRRRTGAAVRESVAEFVGSSMRRSEFCRCRGLSLSTLDRHLKNQRWKRKRKSRPADGQLVAVGLGIQKPPTEQESSCGLAVVLAGGRRIEVQRDFDTYTLALWPKLTRFLQYPELELSNNLAENSMHLVALGRKNWIHIGSGQAGPKVVAILSIVETCRRINILVHDYLAAVLPGFANTPIQCLAQLTPTAWACVGSA
jgi:Transposase IS66 family